MPRETVAASADPIRGFLEAIWRQYGFDLRGYAPASVRRRVTYALAKTGLNDVGELEARCLESPAFFAETLESLTVQVSEMFRDPAFFGAFRARLTPLLRTYPRLDFWVCGCATGEEAYSLAILLTEEGLYDRCRIYATDLSARAIERAKTGVYSGDAIAALVERYRQGGGIANFETYYTFAYDRIAIRDAIRSNMLFFQHDLVNDYTFGEMQVVLCRNVLIYFGRALQEVVLRKLAGSLRSGGFLCLGGSERPSGPASDLFQDFAPDERIYRRTAGVVLR
jgi:chemotaxis protein methyltransferase CheR